MGAGTESPQGNAVTSPRPALRKALRVTAPLATSLPLLATAAVSWAGSQALVRPPAGRARTEVTVTPIGDARSLRAVPGLGDWLPATMAGLPVTGLVRLDGPAPALLRVETDGGPGLLLAPAAPPSGSAAGRTPASAAPSSVPGGDPLERVVLGGAVPDEPIRGLVDAYLFDSPAAAGLAGEALRVPAEDGSAVDGWVAGPGEGGADASALLSGGAVGDGTWAVFAHGRRSPVGQGLRLARAFAAAGVPTVALPHYAGDGPGGRRSGLGHAEWPQVERAVRWAVEAGARRVILAAASMGAAVVTSLLRHSDTAPLVSGLVLDSPVLDWATVVRAAARSRRLPAAAAAPVMALSAWRARLDWADVSLLADPPREPLPTLILHGSADLVTPLSSSERLAALLPDRVRLEVFEGAGHVHSYNRDPRRYESVVERFALRLGDGRRPTGPAS